MNFIFTNTSFICPKMVAKESTFPDLKTSYWLRSLYQLAFPSSGAVLGIPDIYCIFLVLFTVGRTYTHWKLSSSNAGRLLIQDDDHHAIVKLTVDSSFLVESLFWIVRWRCVAFFGCLFWSEVGGANSDFLIVSERRRPGATTRPLLFNTFGGKFE